MRYCWGVALALALVAAWGCREKTAAAPPAARPEDAPWGVPNRAVKVVAYNVHWNLAGAERVAAAIRPLGADVVMVEEVPQRDVVAMAEALGMTHAGTVQAFFSPRPPGGPSPSGTAILAKWPLVNTRYLSIAGDGSPGFGAWAEAVVDGRRFAVMCVHLTPTQNINPLHVRNTEQWRAKEIEAALATWRGRGSPPAVFGGDFNLVSASPNYRKVAEGWTDALAKLGKTDYTCDIGWLKTRVDYLWLTPEWEIKGGDVVTSDASDHRPVWVGVRGK